MSVDWSEFTQCIPMAVYYLDPSVWGGIYWVPPPNGPLLESRRCKAAARRCTGSWKAGVREWQAWLPAGADRQASWRDAQGWDKGLRAPREGQNEGEQPCEWGAPPTHTPSLPTSARSRGLPALIIPPFYPILSLESHLSPDSHALSLDYWEEREILLLSWDLGKHGPDCSLYFSLEKKQSRSIGPKMHISNMIRTLFSKVTPFTVNYRQLDIPSLKTLAWICKHLL